MKLGTGINFLLIFPEKDMSYPKEEQSANGMERDLIVKIATSSRSRESAELKKFCCAHSLIIPNDYAVQEQFLLPPVSDSIDSLRKLDNTVSGKAAEDLEKRLIITSDMVSVEKTLPLRFQLPCFLSEIVEMLPSVAVTRKIRIENQNCFVPKLLFASRVLEWCFRDTLLQNNERSLTSRDTKKMNNKANLQFKGPFPFSVDPYKTLAPNSAPLPYPLLKLSELVPKSRKSRKVKKGTRTLSMTTVLMHEKAMDWAFLETPLFSKAEAENLSPSSGLTDLNLQFGNIFPKMSFDTIDYRYPFDVPNTQKYKRDLLLQPLKVHDLDFILEDGITLPPVQEDLRESYELNRTYLVELLAAASYYVYYSHKTSLKTDPGKLSIYAALVRSFQPLIVDQANTFVNTIQTIRKKLLSGFECRHDENVIPSLIYGPVSPWQHFFHTALVKKLLKNGEKKPLLHRRIL